MNEIRVNRGLSYNVRCSSDRFQPGGVVYVSTFTKNESVGEVIDIILAESARMKTEPVPDSELTGAINYRRGLYPLRFETNDDLATVYSTIWLYDLDPDMYESFQEKIAGIDQQQVMKMSGEYFPGDDYVLVLVGKADEVLPQLQKYGNVTVRPVVEDKPES